MSAMQSRRFLSYDDVIPHRELLEILDYDIQTGVFTWKKCFSNRAPVGSVAGKPNSSGYGLICINGAKYPAHKLAIYWYSGIFPFEDVDHKDGDRGNNRVGNLRAAGALFNAQNRRNPSKNNRSGFLGISRCKATGRWQARILANGVKHYIGRFDTPEEAHAAYLNAKRQLHQGNTL
jgi:hypothetical protein